MPLRISLALPQAAKDTTNARQRIHRARYVASSLHRAPVGKVLTGYSLWRRLFVSHRFLCIHRDSSVFGRTACHWKHERGGESFVRRKPGPNTVHTPPSVSQAYERTPGIPAHAVTARNVSEIESVRIHLNKHRMSVLCAPVRSLPRKGHLSDQPRGRMRRLAPGNARSARVCRTCKAATPPDRRIEPDDASVVAAVIAPVIKSVVASAARAAHSAPSARARRASWPASRRLIDSRSASVR
jgi:hypothetical protein